MKNLLESIDITNFTGLPNANQKLFDAIMKNDSEKVKRIANAMYQKLL